MINFVKQRRLWYLISGIVMVVGIVSMLLNKLSGQPVFNLGIDFTSGTSITIMFKNSTDNLSGRIRTELLDLGIDKHSIQVSEKQSVIIKMQDIDLSFRETLFNQLRSSIGDFELMEVDFIGPSIGDQLKTVSTWIVIGVVFSILLYCSIRFELVFGLAAIVALLHDMLIIFCMAGILKIEINTAFIAALLTVLGYSINDTIVIFDRIREVLASRNDEHEGLSKSLVNKAVNLMLVRSIHTSISTGLVIGAIYIFGGPALSVFSLVLFIGLLTGTYSSLFIASPMTITISKLKGDIVDQ